MGIKTQIFTYMKIVYAFYIKLYVTNKKNSSGVT